MIKVSESYAKAKLTDVVLYQNRVSEREAREDKNAFDRSTTAALYLECKVVLKLASLLIHLEVAEALPFRLTGVEGVGACLSALSPLLAL